MLSIFLALAAGAAVQPEALMCPKTPGDLQYAIDATMHAARMERDPNGGVYGFRRDIAKGLAPHYLRVNFETYQTSEGTRVVAELTETTSFKVEDVQDPKVIAVFQRMLDQIGQTMPCS